MNSSMQSVTIDDDDDDAVPRGEDDKTSSDNDDKPSSTGRDETDVKEDYFKGYFAFALWGYIPPTGGEKYKTAFINTVVKPGAKVKIKQGRKTQREVKKEEKSYMIELDNRGTNQSNKDENDTIMEITEIMMKGCKEMSKQRLYKCRIDKIEFEMRYYSSRIKEIVDELKELREDGDSDDEKENEVKQLKSELKSVRRSKKNAFQNWTVVTQAEEVRRTMVTIADDDSSSGKCKSASGTASSGNSGTNTTIETECSESIPANVNVMVNDKSNTKK